MIGVVGRMPDKLFDRAVRQLQEEFPKLDWKPRIVMEGEQAVPVYQWPGKDGEDVIVCVHKSRGLSEELHRHDYFYFNYTWAGEYESLNRQGDRVRIGKGEIYAGQPASVHALLSHDDRDVVIIGVLVRKEPFFHAFLPLLNADFKLFDFLLGPSVNPCSDQSLLFPVKGDVQLRRLAESLVVEYAARRPDCQSVLKPLVLAFLLMAGRSAPELSACGHARLGARLLEYVVQHPDIATLTGAAAVFGCHPSYASSLIKQETGKTFTQIRLEARMAKASSLLRGTALSVDETARLLGYACPCGFYKDFKKFYGMSPREYAASAQTGAACKEDKE